MTWETRYSHEGWHNTTSRSDRRLNVEQIRLDECPRVGGLEALPAIKIDKRRRIRKLLLKPRELLLCPRLRTYCGIKRTVETGSVVPLNWP